MVFLGYGVCPIWGAHRGRRRETKWTLTPPPPKLKLTLCWIQGPLPVASLRERRLVQEPYSHCCYSFVKRVSLKRIRCYRDTSCTCPYKAVIFKFGGGRETCALKTLGWVQDYLKKLKLCSLKEK
ncbi:C-C motif chemokine 1 [Fukomys damarensis]|uniref:C-C motif chemokine 1 n=1 Tax=Fukomys damarensis TaxID=885580 RepID=UPI0014558762|nr:C-C motif chemokine 1 [Fukomys damarensis]